MNPSNKVLSEKLYKALKEVKITKIHSLPVLNHAKLEFFNGELTITTSDLDNYYTVKVPCIVNREFSTCVPMVHNYEKYSPYHSRVHHTCKAYPFMDFIRVCAEYKDVLEFEFNPQIQVLTIKVQGERSVTEFKCIDAMEFPQGE